MHLLHQHAIRYEFTERNAINKSSAKWEEALDSDQVGCGSASPVTQHVGSVQTEASGKAIPLDDTLIDELLLWRAETPYADLTAATKSLQALRRRASSPAGCRKSCRLTSSLLLLNWHSTEGLAHSSSQLRDTAEAERE